MSLASDLVDIPVALLACLVAVRLTKRLAATAASGPVVAEAV